MTQAEQYLENNAFNPAGAEGVICPRCGVPFGIKFADGTAITHETATGPIFVLDILWLGTHEEFDAYWKEEHTPEVCATLEEQLEQDPTDQGRDF